MGFFSHNGVVLSGHNALDTAVSDLELRTTSGGTYLISTSGANGGIVSYNVGSRGALNIAGTHFFTGAQARLDSSKISILDINGSPYVVTGSVGSQNLQGQALSNSGDLGATTRFDGFTSNAGAIPAMAEVELSGGQFFFLANQTGRNVDVYRMGAQANYLSSSSFRDTIDSYAANIVDMAEATVGNKTFLLTLSATENGLSCFGVNNSNGALTHCGSFGADQGLGIYAATDLEVVNAFGATYALVASAGTSSLSVLQINAQGELQRADHILDTLHTRFGGVTSVETVTVGDQVYVIAGGADDGLSLFVMLPGGRLQYLDTVVQTATNNLGDVQDIVAMRDGSDIQVFVSSAKTKGISRFTIDLPTLGDNKIGRGGSQDLTGTEESEVLSGGDGDDTMTGGFGNDYLYDGDGSDTMTGGGGADIFALVADGKTEKILDYQPYHDWIDLSAFPMLYSHHQVEFQQTSTGAVVTYRDETIEITHGANRPLAFHQVFWKTFSGPDRPAWNLEAEHIGTPGNDRITGSYLIDIMRGGPGNDILIGGAGSDRLEGEGGRDTLDGGTGGDFLIGGYADDTLFGGDGDDTLSGNQGRDRINGGTGNDVARLGPGDDIGRMGLGDDKAFGGGGADRIYGEAGKDFLRGDKGNDILVGGKGNDTLRLEGGDDTGRGDGGDDLIVGGKGNDTLVGGNGKDKLIGGAGSDIIRAGNGKDRVIGGTGMDTVDLGGGNDIYVDSGINETGIWDRIVGGNGDDRIIGKAGADRFFGNNGNDVIFGGRHNDVLNGGEGKDILQGNAGRDVLIGGAGRDTFVFRRSDGRDVIRGFENNIDKIKIDIKDMSFRKLKVSYSGGDTHIGYDSDKITLEDVTIWKIGAEDFIFG